MFVDLQNSGIDVEEESLFPEHTNNTSDNQPELDGIEHVVKISHALHPIQKLSTKQLNTLINYFADASTIAGGAATGIIFKDVKVVSNDGHIIVTCMNTYTHIWLVNLCRQANDIPF